MKRFAIYDIGGQSVRLAVLDEEGNFLWMDKVPIGLVRLNKCVEHDPDEIITACRTLMVSCMKWSTVAINTFALATQRSSIISWDKSSAKPLSKIISWQDTRGDKLLQDLLLEEGLKQSRSVTEVEHKIKTITGLYPSAHYGASKISLSIKALKQSKKYLNKNIQDQCVVVTPLVSWVLVQLNIMFDSFDEKCLSETDFKAIVDEGQAQRTMLWNIETQHWDSDLLKLFDIPEELLPRVTTNLVTIPPINDTSITCRLIIGDQSAALFAHGMPRADTCYINAGTGAFILQPYDLSHVPAIPGELLNTIVYRDEKTKINAIEATINGAASALVYCDTETDTKEACRPSYSSLNVLGGHCCFLNGISGLASPWWKPDFDSVFINVRTVSEKYQSVYESILFMIKNNFDCIRKHENLAKQVIFSGGLSQDRGFCQALAALLKVPVYLSTMHEATLQGAAYILASDARQESAADWTYHEFSAFTSHQGSLERIESLPDADSLLTRYDFWSAEMDKAVRFTREAPE